MNTDNLISFYGGQSGQFCCHSQDSLEDLIQGYIDKAFKAVGITEHMPPPSDDFLYPDEAEQGLITRDLQERFGRYFEELDRFKSEYNNKRQIFKGF